MEPINHLKTLHEVLAESRFDPPGAENPQEDGEQGKEAPMRCGSYRVETDIKAMAEMICKQNGSSLSAFLRRCCQTLVLEYQ